MSSASRLLVVSLGALAALTLSVGRAGAEPGPIELISKSSSEQANAAEAPAISGDGSYVAFQGTLDGLTGVFRKDLQTGAIAVVSAGSAYVSSSSTSATAPSISADGRYVSFTTRAQLDPTDDHYESSSDVYVADMSTDPPTYELASALNDSRQGLNYEEPTKGSVAAGRVALSADGRKVAFVTTAASNLTGDPGGTETPAGQVVLRNLETDETTLVSVERDPLTGQMEPGQPVPGGAVFLSAGMKSSLGAALSADGTTVAWLSSHLPAQVPLLPEEAAEIEHDDSAEQFPALPYSEPLWRRVGGGPDAVTRRITGGAGDSQAPGCPAGGSLADPACDGVFAEIMKKSNQAEEVGGWLGWSGLDGIPQLSADGNEVALIGDPTTSYGVNLFLIDMASGLSRSEAVRQLTREVVVEPGVASAVNGEKNIPQNGHIFDLAFSLDGRRIAFVTARQQFPLSPPNLIGSPPSSLGLVELYLVDLEGETLQRLTHGDGGIAEPSLAPAGVVPSPKNGEGATSPSFDAGGETIAFASKAANLVEGDGNNASDAFVVRDPRSSSRPGSSTVPPPPPPVEPTPRWRLALSASSLPNGKVRLVAVVPAAGVVQFRAAGTTQLGSKPHRLAHGRKRTAGSGAARFTLSLPRRMRRLAHRGNGFTGTARLSFHSPFGKVLHGSLQIRFHAHKVHHGRRR